MLKIKISGVIIPNDYKWIYDLFEVDSTSPGDVNKILDSLSGEEVEVEINSPGGDVYSGSEIYTALMNYSIKGRVTVSIVGVAASAASVIAMAGKPVRISPTAQIMIHNVWGASVGDYRVMEHDSGIFKSFNTSIANAYRLKTGLSEERLLELMNAGGSANAGTWMNAQQAKELGFVDEIMFDDGNRLAASASPLMIPPEIINKIRNLIPKPPTSGEDKGLYQARLNLLKLRGGHFHE